jgi:molecular chaperone DnaK
LLILRALHECIFSFSYGVRFSGARSEIDLTFEISESRDVTVSAFLNGTGQEFSQVFSPKSREVSTRLLAGEILMLEEKVQTEVEEAEEAGNREVASKLAKVLGGVQELMASASELAEDDVTDQKFQLEDRKRKLAQEMFELTSTKRLDAAKARYAEVKDEVVGVVRESGNDRERHVLSEIIAREPSFLSSTNPEKIQQITEELNSVQWGILARTPEFLKGMFAHLVERRASMNDQIQATQLIESGKRAVERQDIDDLRVINSRLWDLMPAKEQTSDEMRAYTGIV